MFKLKTILILSVLAIVGVGMAGCTSFQSNTTTNSAAQTSQVHAYADAYNSATEKSNPNAQTTVNIVDNGTNAVRVSSTIVNHSTNGTNMTSTEALNIKQFDNKDDATAFFNNVSFGYVRNDSTAPSSNTKDDPYFIAMGHTPTIIRGAVKIDSLTFVSASMSIAIQEDEFVTYGTISATL